MEYVHIDSRDGRDWCLSLHVEYVHIDSRDGRDWCLSLHVEYVHIDSRDGRDWCLSNNYVKYCMFAKHVEQFTFSKGGCEENTQCG